MKKLVISVVLVNLLAACASEKPAVVAEPSPPPRVEPAKVVEPPRVEAAKPVPVPAPPVKTEIDPLNDPTNILSKRSTYYPFDIAAVQDEDKPLVQAHGRYLGEHINRKVRLEGNCDERGSNEYNIGLGQRRADGVKKMLELSGANSSQLESFSYGEEKPRCTSHNEECWKQNRRTDLNYR